MSEYAHAGFIHGELVAGNGAQISVEDPSTGAVFARLPGLDESQVAAAIQSARAAFDSGVWSGLPANERAAQLGRFIGALAAKKDRLE